MNFGARSCRCGGAVVPVVAAAQVDVGQPQHLGLVVLGRGCSQARLGRGDHQRPGVRQPQGRGQVDRQRLVRPVRLGRRQATAAGPRERIGPCSGIDSRRTQVPASRGRWDICPRRMRLPSPIQPAAMSNSAAQRQSTPGESHAGILLPALGRSPWPGTDCRLCSSIGHAPAFTDNADIFHGGHPRSPVSPFATVGMTFSQSSRTHGRLARRIAS